MTEQSWAMTATDGTLILVDRTTNGNIFFHVGYTEAYLTSESALELLKILREAVYPSKKELEPAKEELGVVVR